MTDYIDINTILIETSEELTGASVDSWWTEAASETDEVLTDLEKLFEFEELEPEKGLLPKDERELRRAKFSKWLKHQFDMHFRGGKPLNVRDRSAFKEKDGELFIQLRYGTSPLKGVSATWVKVKGGESFERELLNAVGRGAFDKALEETAKRQKPKGKKEGE